MGVSVNKHLGRWKEEPHQSLPNGADFLIDPFHRKLNIRSIQSTGRTTFKICTDRGDRL